MKSPVLRWVRVRLITRIHERSFVHRIDAHEHAEEIRALRDLVNPWLTSRALGFDPELARSGKNLARDEKRDHTRHDLIPRHITSHQVVVVAAITVTDKIRVVFVEANLLTF